VEQAMCALQQHRTDVEHWGHDAVPALLSDDRCTGPEERSRALGAATGSHEGMKLICAPPLPRVWATHKSMRGLLLERDVPVNSGKLRAKLLVFDNTVNLRHFWRHGVSMGELGRFCKGAVNGLFHEVLTFSGPKETAHIEADPRYFCVIGLVKGHLSAEIVAHECIHAAFNFVKRKARCPWDVLAKDMNEEAVCYPAGRLVGRINDILHAEGLY
jgi:hypothetical protein